MAVFYDDPYAWIDDACESIERMDQSRAQSELMAAIAIILLGIAEAQHGLEGSPSAGDYPDEL